jgi:cytochrome c-type biogenesis protein CcmH
MLFLALAVMALIVLGFVLTPLARGVTASFSRERFARAVYRDQLDELNRDVERGVIDTAQADAAKTEIQRRLLSTGGDDAPNSSTPRPVLAAGIGIAVLIAAALLYLKLGSPSTPDLPFADRAAERSAAQHQMPVDLDQAVAGLEAKLAANPANLDGWLLLSRTEATREHWQKSAEAMRHAADLAKNRPDIAAAYGEVLVRANGGLVTPPARDAFNAALSGEPDNPQALWYLGLASVQDHKIGEAQTYWRKLLAALPADSDDRKLVAEALAALDSAAKPK